MVGDPEIGGFLFATKTATEIHHFFAINLDFGAKPFINRGIVLSQLEFVTNRRWNFADEHLQLVVFGNLCQFATEHQHFQRQNHRQQRFPGPFSCYQRWVGLPPWCSQDEQEEDDIWQLLEKNEELMGQCLDQKSCLLGKNVDLKVPKNPDRVTSSKKGAVERCKATNKNTKNYINIS